jgi:hypothetical protein
MSIHAEEMHYQAVLTDIDDLPTYKSSSALFSAELSAFDAFGTPTRFSSIGDGEDAIPVFTNEFWTSKQRAASSLHEISYRACFKPQLPRFFIERLTKPGQLVYDPFLGRGTTMIEAALLGRQVIGCDVNPLSRILCEPRLTPPSLTEVRAALEKVAWKDGNELPPDLLAFYHPATLRQIVALRGYLSKRPWEEKPPVDRWIQMVATNRLTGHSAGFFSVYTLPPNQAVSAERQRKINQMRSQTPPERSVPELILRKTRSLLRTISLADRSALDKAASAARFTTGSCHNTSEISDNSVDLVITSPPFLDVVDYAGDNWLRCWFNGIDEKAIKIWILRNAASWMAAMKELFLELRRVLKPGGHMAFEVGEVRSGKLRMEELVIPAARSAGLQPLLVVINSQEFTKTSNCWGVSNQVAGTNTNRVVLLRKFR